MKIVGNEIMTDNCRVIGTIDLTDDKYKDEVIRAIEYGNYTEITEEIIDILPDIQSSDYRIIDEALDKMTVEEITDLLSNIISIVNFSK